MQNSAGKPDLREEPKATADPRTRTEFSIDEAIIIPLSPQQIEQERAFLNELYKTHKIAAYNFEFYRREIKRLSLWNKTIEISAYVGTFLTAGSGVSHALLTRWDTKGAITAILATGSAIITGFRPKTNRWLNSKISKFSKKYTQYNRLFADLTRACGDLWQLQSITEEIKERWEKIKARYDEEQRDIPPNYNQKRYDRVQIFIHKQYPKSYYWRGE
jgi:hypothetical protein